MVFRLRSTMFAFYSSLGGGLVCIELILVMSPLLLCDLGKQWSRPNDHNKELIEKI